MHMKNRSSWLSGRGNVALVIHRVLRGENHERRAHRVRLASIVTRARSITSSRADCVLGVVRLISSARTTLANTGPFLNTNSFTSRRRWRHRSRRSAAGRSELNAWNVQSIDGPARRRACLAHPGQVLDEQMAAAARQTSTWSITSSLPFDRLPHVGAEGGPAPLASVICGACTKSLMSRHG